MKRTLAVASRSHCSPLLRVLLLSLPLLTATGVSVRAADTVAIGVSLPYTNRSVVTLYLGESQRVHAVPRAGQTFLVPATHPRLESFSFWVEDSHVFEPQPTVFHPVLMECGTDRPFGPVLYQGTPHTTQGMVHGEMRRFSFNVGLNLLPQHRYIFFLDALPYRDGVSNFLTFGAVFENVDYYPDGKFLYSDLLGPIEEVGNANWTGTLSWDLSFRAEFSALPPRFQVRRLEGGDLALTWPTNAPGFQLQAATTLQPASWTPATNDVSLAGSDYFVRVPPTAPHQFFRLRTTN